MFMVWFVSRLYASWGPRTHSDTWRWRLVGEEACLAGKHHYGNSCSSAFVVLVEVRTCRSRVDMTLKHVNESTGPADRHMPYFYVAGTHSPWQGCQGPGAHLLFQLMPCVATFCPPACFVSFGLTWNFTCLRFHFSPCISLSPQESHFLFVKGQDCPSGLLPPVG